MRLYFDSPATTMDVQDVPKGYGFMDSHGEAYVVIDFGVNLQAMVVGGHRYPRERDVFVMRLKTGMVTWYSDKRGGNRVTPLGKLVVEND